MKSNYKRLGDYIRQIDERNIEDKRFELLGVSVEKRFIKSIANTVGTDWRGYKIIRRGQFCYISDTSRRGDKIGIALQNACEIALVSQAYTVFEITNLNVLNPAYLELWFKRTEFDRYARYHSHGSVREIFDWDTMCDVMLPIPSLAEQQKIVDAYNVIENRIALKRKINDNLEAASHTIFKRSFIDKGAGDKYPSGYFSDIILCDIGGDWGSNEPSGNQITEICCVRGTDTPNINRGTIENVPIRYILAKNANAKRLIAFDIVVEISGGSPTQSTGRLALIHPECLSQMKVPLLCSNFCRALRIKPNYALYAYYYWLYLYRNRRLFCYENSSTGLKNLDICGFITEEVIPIPPAGIISQFNSEIENIRSDMLRNQREIDNLINTKKLILPHIMHQH